MSYEINIIAVNQKKEVELPFYSTIVLQNENNNSEVNRYEEIWPYFSNTTGVLYSLVKEINDGFYSSFPLCDSDFDMKVPERLLPNWINDEIKYNLTPLIIKDYMYNDFIKIIDYLLSCSPNRTIMFQSRYQGGDYEVILGVLKLEAFLDMLNKKEILFNVCYIIIDN